MNHIPGELNEEAVKAGRRHFAPLAVEAVVSIMAGQSHPIPGIRREGMAVVPSALSAARGCIRCRTVRSVVNDGSFEACLKGVSSPRPCPRSETAMSTLPPSAVSSSAPTEASMISRLVAIFIPVFAVAAGWFAGLIAQAVPGAHLDQNQIVAFMTAAAVSAITAGWKWLQGWQQHEALVAQGLDVPVKAGPPAAAAAARAPLPTPVASPATN
jgi:hypothetical protein